MSDKEFLQALGERAEEEMKGIRAEAEAEAARIVEGAERRVEERRSRRLEEARREGERERSRLVNRASMESRKIVLEAQHALFEELLRGVREQLRILRGGEKYRAALKALIEECEPAPGELLLAAEGEGELCREIVRDLGLEVDIEEEPRRDGGVSMRSADGSSLRRNAFEDRLAKRLPELRLECARLFLVGGGGK